MNPTPEQAQAVATNARYVCVDAGAGSGKTRVLIERILQRLADRSCTLDRIVAITFTEKAAIEMKDRLRAACRKRAEAAADDPRAQSFWRDQERATDTARITTIHSFCMALVKEHALRLGMDPDFAMLEDTDSYLLLRDTVEIGLRAMYDEAFDPALRTAAEHGGAALAGMMMDLIAKHRSTVRQWAHANSETSPSALVDTWRGCVEAHNRETALFLQTHPQLTALCEEVAALETCCTDRSDKRALFRESLQGILTGVTSGTVETVARAVTAIGDLNGRGGSAKKWNSPHAFARPLAMRDELKAICAEHALIAFDPLREARAAHATLDLAKVFVRLETAFRDAKKRMNAADFDDLILEAHRILSEHEPIRQSASAAIRHLFVDEFQDTDSIQYEIVSMLASASPDLCRFIVGDAKQSIYLFRGAEVDVFQRARTEAEEGIVLDTNFRTVPGVFAFINDFFGISNLLKAVEPAYRPAKINRSTEEERRIEFLIPEQIPDDPDEDRSAEAYRTLEAALIADRIAGLCDPVAGITIEDPATGAVRKAAFGDVAILFRSSSNVPLYERALREAGVPFTVIAGTGYYERQEVMDLRNILTVVTDPWNEMALVAVLRGPFIGVTDETLMRLAPATTGSLAQAFYNGVLTGVDSEDALLTNGRALLAELRAHAETPPAALIRLLLGRTQFEAMLLAQFLGVQKASNVRKVLDLAEAFSRGHAPSLSAFLRFLEEAAAEKIREGEAVLQVEDNQSVILMTVHKAKGLEFPIVFVPDMARRNDGANKDYVLAHREWGLAARVRDDRGEPDTSAIFHMMSQKQKQADHEESARVLYVALTRARDYLVLSGAPKDTARSWFDPMDERWGITECADGATIAGPGWQATVRRKVAKAHIAPRPTAGPQINPAIRARLLPLSEEGRGAEGWRATAVAATLAGTAMDDDVRPARVARAYALDPNVRGDFVHRFFETIHRRIDKDVAARSIAREAGLYAAAQDAFALDLLAMADRLASAKLATPQGIEVPFALRTNVGIIHGAVDAVLADGAILDYKTGARQASVHAKYEWQLRIYAWAMQTLCGAPPPAAYLFYVDDPSADAVVPVDVSAAMLAETAARVNNLALAPVPS